MRVLGAMAVWCTLATAAADAGIQVWAVSDAVRVDPVSGRALEHVAGEFRERAVSLQAARNEFVAFQALIESDGPAEEIDIALPPLRRAGGGEIAGRVFKEWYVRVRRASTGYEASSFGPGWYPDALMPYRKGTLHAGFPFSIPDLYNNIPGQRNQAIWVDVYVPMDAAPGRYTGELKVTWKGGGGVLPVALEVWNFALPQENHVPGDIWNGSMKDMPPHEEMAYYQLARQHRFLPLIYAYRPKLTVTGAKAVLDWTEYDRRVAPYLDGSAFTSRHGYWGPGYGLPVTHMMLPFDIEKRGNRATAWPAPLPAGGRTREYEALWTDVARQVREHLDSVPAWRKVRKIAFLNGLDESYSEDAYEKMLYYGNLLHEAMGRGWFLYRIDGGYTPEAMAKLSREVELWVCHTVAFDPDLVERYRAKGIETWFYGPMIYEQKKNSGCGSNTFLDLDLLVNRGIGWVAWKYRSGWVEWEFDWNAYAAWYEAENFKEAHRIYNGSGQLIYRGAVMGYREPIPSIRLKSQRRGLQDYEYFWLLTERTGSRAAADAIVNRIVHKRPFGVTAMRDTGVWSKDPHAWKKARIEIGERLNGLR